MIQGRGLRLPLRLATDDRLVTCIRRGEPSAFEALYERHSVQLLSFCAYMLGSRHDAEDAVQATFASAYRALLADARAVTLRPWLFAIARNECLSILRARRPTVELNGEPAPGDGLLRELELRTEVRQVLEDLRDLPERQRAALILAELHGLSQSEIGTVLGVRADQVKAYIYQARSNLVSEKTARETDCREIREELANARGAALRRARLRRHVRSCADCRVYADGVAHQRRALGALLPLAPSLVLKYRAIEQVLGRGAAEPAVCAASAVAGGSVVSVAAEFAGGGIKALAVKMAAGLAFVGASAGLGVSALSTPVASHGRGALIATTAEASTPLTASIGRANKIGWEPHNRVLAGGPRVESPPAPVGARDSQPSVLSSSQPGGSNGSSTPATTGPGDTRQRGRAESQEHVKKSEEHQQKSQEQHQQKGQEHEEKSEEHQQKDEEHDTKGEEHQQKSQEEHQQKTQERVKKSEEHKREREARERVGRSHPPRNEEERKQAQEERQRTHEEHQRALEEHRREREERRRAHEEG